MSSNSYFKQPYALWKNKICLQGKSSVFNSRDIFRQIAKDEENLWNNPLHPGWTEEMSFCVGLFGKTREIEGGGSGF